MALAYVGVRFALLPGSVPTFAGGRTFSALLALAAVGLFVAPAALHLVAALTTVALIAFVRERAGVSETVQVIAYAAAPCARAGAPIPALRLACGAYAAALLVVGLREVHGASLPRAAAVAVVPAALVIGYGFGWFAAFDAAVGGDLGGIVDLARALR